MHKSCTILLLDGVGDGSVGISLDVLGAARRLVQAGIDKTPPKAILRPRLVSVDGRPVTSSAGRTLPVDGAFSPRSLTGSDYVVVPGLGIATPEAIDAAMARADMKSAMTLLAQAERRGAHLAASCSATFVLAAACILDGHEATTTWWLSRELARRYPQIKVRADRMVVRSGRLLTAGSAFAHADLMLAVLSDTAGPRLAQLVARYLVIDERPSQARYMISHHLRTDDPAIRKLERFVVGHMAEALTISDLSRAIGVSARTLARKLQEGLGVTPLHFVQRLKVERAVHLLETTEHSVEAVSSAVGYADPAAFRRVLRRETGLSPRQVRAPRA